MLAIPPSGSTSDQSRIVQWYPLAPPLAGSRRSPIKHRSTPHNPVVTLPPHNQPERPSSGLTETPTLTAKVADVLHFYPCFFFDFPCHALLKGLTGFNKARDNGIHAGFVARMLGQQNFIVLTHRHNHTRRHTRIMRGMAGTAHHGHFCFAVVALRATLRAELLSMQHVRQLCRSASELEEFRLHREQFPLAIKIGAISCSGASNQYTG